jgi:hypothetical protein
MYIKARAGAIAICRSRRNYHLALELIAIAVRAFRAMCRPTQSFRKAEMALASISGLPSFREAARAHIAPAYDSATMAMTAALSTAADWPLFASWLPFVADQVSALNGAAFGARGVMAQNIQNSTAYGEAVREYNNWSQRNWKRVTDARDASTQRNQESFRRASAKRPIG